jgi:hypothetical protein
MRGMRSISQWTSAAVSAVIVCAGCRPDTGPYGPLSVPPAGMVRLIPGAVPPVSPDRVGWTWSILGERNWIQPSATESRLSLRDAYPLNDVQRMHGCNTWNCGLALVRDPAHPDSARWTLTLHGSNGATAQSQGTVALAGRDLTAVAQVVQDRDATTSLPATFTIARLANHDITVAVAK